MSQRRFQTRRYASHAARALVLAVGAIAMAGSACERRAPALAADPAAHVESVTVSVPPLEAARAGEIAWRRLLVRITLSSGIVWSAANVSAVLRHGEDVVVADAGNNELLVLDARSGVPERLIGGIGQDSSDLAGPNALAGTSSGLVVGEVGNRRVKLLDSAWATAAQIPLRNPPLLLSAHGDRLIMVTTSDGKPQVVSRRCCSRQLPPQVVSLEPALERQPRYAVALPDGGLLLATAPSELSLYGDNGVRRRIVRFVRPRTAPATSGDSTAPALELVTAVGEAQAGRVPVAFGSQIGCLDPATGALTGLVRLPVGSDGRHISVQHLTPIPGGWIVHTFFDELALLRGGCERRGSQQASRQPGDHHGSQSSLDA